MIKSRETNEERYCLSCDGWVNIHYEDSGDGDGSMDAVCDNCGSYRVITEKEKEHEESI